MFLQTKRYRVDGYEWKTRKTTKTVREDRMKLKVGGYQVCEITSLSFIITQQPYVSTDNRCCTTVIKLGLFQIVVAIATNAKSLASSPGLLPAFQVGDEATKGLLMLLCCSKGLYYDLRTIL